MTSTSDAFEQDAAAARAAALTRDTIGHVWRNQTLQPWTSRREIFFQSLEARASESGDLVEASANSLDRLEVIEKNIDALIAKHAAADPKVSKEIELPPRDTLVNWHAFLASAARVLWLAHHTSDQWMHLRAEPDAWLQKIEDWADEYIQPYELSDAVKLAYLLRTEHRQFITMPRPEKRKTTGVDSGN